MKYEKDSKFCASLDSRHRERNIFIKSFQYKGNLIYNAAKK